MLPLEAQAADTHVTKCASPIYYRRPPRQKNGRLSLRFRLPSILIHRQSILAYFSRIYCQRQHTHFAEGLFMAFAMIFGCHARSGAGLKPDSLKSTAGYE